MIKFAYTILYVRDVAKSIEFYEKVFDFKRKFLTPVNDYGEIASGETTLAFASIELAQSNLKDGFIESKSGDLPFGVELAFTTDQVDALTEKAIQNGAIEVEKATTKPWGQTVAYIRDINGFLVEICTPMNN